MSTGVEFEGDKLAALQKMQSYGGQPRASSKFAQWLIDRGLAKTEAGAQRVLLGIVVLNVILTIAIIRYIL